MKIPKWLYERFRREDGATFRRVGPYTRTTVGDYATTRVCGGWLFRSIRIGDLLVLELFTATIYRRDKAREYR